jgi:hypothetical protein
MPELRTQYATDTRAGDTVNNKVMYRWNATPPYAARYAQSVAGEKGSDFGTQVSRAYPVYYCTEQLIKCGKTPLRNKIRFSPIID